MLGLAALLTLVSGVAMVSAYESHVVNVTAHVENALNVEPKIIEFGDVEPQQWLIEGFNVGISSSFSTQTRVSKIDYSICAEWKVDEGRNFAWWNGTQWVVDSGFYNWMGYFTYVGIDTGPDPLAGDMTLVGDPPEELGVPAAPGTKAKCVLASSMPLCTPDNLSDNVTIGVDVPVYEGAYTLQIPMPSGLDEPSWVIPTEHPAYDEEYMEFGIDLIIQVTNIYD